MEDEKNTLEAVESEDTLTDEDDTSLIEEIAALNSKIDELTRKNNTLVAEYKRLKNSKERVTENIENSKPRGYDVNDIIKNTYRGVFK